MNNSYKWNSWAIQENLAHFCSDISIPSKFVIKQKWISSIKNMQYDQSLKSEEINVNWKRTWMTGH